MLQVLFQVPGLVGATDPPLSPPSTNEKWIMWALQLPVRPLFPPPLPPFSEKLNPAEAPKSDIGPGVGPCFAR